MKSLVNIAGVLALISGTLLAVGYFYNEQVIGGALANAEITVGPYKFRPTPITLDSVRNTLTAQLPGPAAGGWFVLIGQDPDSDARCMAFIVSSAAANGKQWVGISKEFEPQNKFGPFSTIEEAGSALRKAGWSTFSDQIPWFASSGCRITARPIPPPPPPVQYNQSQLTHDYIQKVVQQFSRYLPLLKVQHNGILPGLFQKKHRGGEVEINFTIARSGQLIDVAVVQASGDQALDREMLNAFRQAAPYPPFLVGLEGDQVSYTLPITATENPQCDCFNIVVNLRN